MDINKRSYTAALSLLIYLILFPIPALPAEVQYEVKPKDTLYSLSRHFEVPVEDIMSVNRITDPTQLSVGTILTIPSRYEVYTVEPGDTLWAISRKFQIEIEQLRRINGLSEDKVLRVGQNLKIPQQNAVADGGKTDDTAVEHTVSATRVPEKDTSGEMGGAIEYYWPHEGSRSVWNSTTGGVRGVTIQGSPGDEIVSVSQGKVVLIQTFMDFGRVVFVKSPENYIYLYGGYGEILVDVGDVVTPGEVIRVMDETVRGDGASLFFTIYKDTKPVDLSGVPRR